MYYHKRRALLYYLGMLSTTLFMGSCVKTNIPFGQQFVDNGYTQIIQIDSFTPRLSTIYIDSFPTSTVNFSFVGKYTDSAFGNVNASAYFQLGAPAYDASSTEFNAASFDSLTLYIKLTNAYYGDTTLPINIQVNPLTERIVAPNSANNSTILYNTDSFSSAATPIGQTSYLLKPGFINSTNDSISIRLDDSLGIDILNKLRTKNASITSNELFAQYFNGIKLSATSNTDLAIMISDSVTMRLYYKTPAAPFAIQKIASFQSFNNGLHFSNITINRTGQLKNANIGSVNNEIPSQMTDSSAFMQPITGTLAKITFPSIQSIVQTHNFIKIAKATLYIKPVKGSFEGIYYLPNTLQLAGTDLNNGIGNPITNASGAIETGNLVVDYLNGVNTQYSYDVTAFINSLISNQTANSRKLGLILSPISSSLFSGFSRLILGDANNSNAQMQLVIDYISLK
ncbi:DUF4270 family protein [Arachidicoccus sp.]|uniref:DUF4270 family protein n=1 Tax=Arachidicoccus sp. TaxID=1872624 RepID=UPI003D1ECD4E